MFYSVEISVINFSDPSKSKHFSYEFKDPKNTPLENRDLAIQKFRAMEDLFEEDVIPVDNSFISPDEAKNLLELKGNALSINLNYFKDDDPVPYVICGEDVEECLDSLEGEANNYESRYGIKDFENVRGYRILKHRIEELIYARS